MAKYKIIPSSRTIVQSPISIGHKAEKGVEAIEFDLTAWVETYGSGTLTVIMRRWGDAIPYPIALEIDENNKATWTLSDIDTAKAGMAYAQLSYVVGDEVVKKSDIYTFRVMDSLTGEGGPPEAYESWLEHLTHFAAEAMAEVLDIEGIVTDKTLTVDGGIADAKAAGDALSALEDQLTEKTDQLKADLGDLEDRVEALEDGGNSGIPIPVKNAILTLFENVAFYKTDVSEAKAILEAWVQEVVSITLNVSTLNIVRDGVYQLIATTVPAGGSVLWESTNTDVATVDANGVVQGVGNGQCNIVASAGDISATCAVTISGYVQYSITNVLTNCVNTNSTTSVVHGESYHAEFTSPQGRLETCTCTMGGVQQTVTDGVIDIAEVTGDIVITAVGANSAYAGTNIVLDGSSYINTDIELFSAENIDRDFKLVVNLSTTGKMMVDPFGVIVGSMEEVGVVGYPGFTIRNKRNTNMQLAGRNIFFDKASTLAPFTFGIKRIGGTYYGWFGSDESTATEMDSTYITHTALVNCPVVLGCQLSNRGTSVSRYWAGTIDSIEIKWL